MLSTWKNTVQVPSLGNTTIFLLSSTRGFLSFIYIFICFLFLVLLCRLFFFILTHLPIQPLVLGSEIFNHGWPLHHPLVLKYSSCSELGDNAKTFEFWPSFPVVILE